MLVLSRKVDETVHIGPDIEVMVVRAENGRVRLGITAPEDVCIWRPNTKNRPPQHVQPKEQE